MCTVTVRRDSGTPTAKAQILTVTMNRDERRDRAPEIKPQIHQHGIYPVDSEAGGTWFGVNQKGVCLSLLNRYDEIAYEAQRSRGLLIPELLRYASIAEIKSELISIDLKQFAPFTLMINTFDACEIIQWTGSDFILERPIISEYMHISSSSWQSKKVLPWRQKVFEEWVENGAQHQSGMPAYNLYQPKGKAEYAPFVSREKSFTKSITQYHCQGEQMSSRYWAEHVLPNGKPDQLTMPLHIA